MVKILKDDELPLAVSEICPQAKKLGVQFMPQVWNEMLKYFHQKYKEMTAQQLLAASGNFFNIFACLWVREMKKICEADDNDISAEELLKEIFEGIVATFGGEIIFHQPSLPSEIKTLTGK